MVEVVRADSERLFAILGHAAYSEQAMILNDPSRFILVTGGQQGGKSWTARLKFQQELARDLGRHPGFGDGEGPPLLYWLIAPAYGEAEKEYGYIVEDLETLSLPVKVRDLLAPGLIEVKYPNESKARIRVEVKSATDIRKLSKDSPHGIIICEPGQVGPEVYERAQGRLSGRSGWLFMPGTLENSIGWFPQLADQWSSGFDSRRSFMLPTWANRELYPGGRSDPKVLEIERNSSEEYFKQRFGGERVTPRGLVFKEAKPDEHISAVEYRPEEDVYLTEDPGYGSESAHALYACHKIGSRIEVFDEIYERGRTTEEIIHIAMGRPWWQSATESQNLVSDPHYKDQHHSTTSVAEIWLRETGLVARPDYRIPILPGTERMRVALKRDPLTNKPNLIISPRCQGLLSEFGLAANPLTGLLQPYRWKTDRDGNVYGEKPDDRFNHGIKALIYLLVTVFGYARSQQRDTIPVIRRRDRVQGGSVRRVRFG